MRSTNPPQAGMGDALFVFAEDGVTHAHIGSCATFAGPVLPLAALTAAVGAQLQRAERFKQLARFLPGDLDRPVWVADPSFVLADHVHTVSLPTCADDSALQVLMSDLMTNELPDNRSLWDMWLVDGLTEGRWAIVSKVHPGLVHPSLVDSVGGTDLLTGLLGNPSGLWSFAGILKPWTPHQRAPSAPGVVTEQRHWAFARCRLGDIRAICAAFGGSVNGVVLAATAGAFRDLLNRQGTSPPAVEFSALVPAGRGGDDRELDHRDPMVLVELPIDVDDPVERLALAHNRLGHLLDHSHPIKAVPMVRESFDVLPASLFTWALHNTAALVPLVPQRTVNTVVTNMVAWEEPLFALGREMLEYVPFVPIGEGHRIGVAVITYNDVCTFGITGDVTSADDAAFLAGRLEAAVRELVELIPTARRLP